MRIIVDNGSVYEYLKDLLDDLEPGQLVRVADTLAVREIGMGVHTAASVKADDEDLIWWPSIGNFAAMYGWCKRSLICILDS
jgi:hypothetical protein